MAIIISTDQTPRAVYLEAHQAVIQPDKEEQTKSVSYDENGDYQVTPDAGKTLAKVNVNVDVPDNPPPVIEPLSVTQNGTYNVPAGTDGWNPVTVNVPGVQKYSGTITPATDTRPISVTVPKSSVAKPQDIAIVADVEDITSVQTYTTLKVGGQRALVTDFANDLSNINEANGLLAYLRTATAVAFTAATVTFSETAVETTITITPPSAYYFRSAITYNFTVYGWEDTP